MAKQITKPEKQLSFVVDLNKCIGCQTCTVACKKLWTNQRGEDPIYWRNVETRPGKGYPRNWENEGGGFNAAGEVQRGRMPTAGDYGVPFEFDYEARLFEGVPGRVRPRPAATTAAFASWAPNFDEDQGEGAYPNNYYFYLPRHCNHCSKPACLEACPNDAIYKRAADGIVLVDQTKCKAARNCVQACPYDKTYFNTATQKASKCIGCYPRIEKGVATACVAQCVGRAMHVGFMEDTASSVHKLAKVWKVALPLYAERGTEPNLFYIPPVLGPTMEDAQGNLRTDKKIPIEYLVKLFGNDVPRVMKVLNDERGKRLMSQPSELMDIMIGRRSADMMLNPLT